MVVENDPSFMCKTRKEGEKGQKSCFWINARGRDPMTLGRGWPQIRAQLLSVTRGQTRYGCIDMVGEKRPVKALFCVFLFSQ